MGSLGPRKAGVGPSGHDSTLCRCGWSGGHPLIHRFGIGAGPDLGLMGRLVDLLQLGDERGCLVLDIRMPGMSGLELQQKLLQAGSNLPIIFITGHGDVPMAVEAMRHGAIDFLRKPVNETDFLDRISSALDHESGNWHKSLDRRQARARIESLSEREYEVFIRVAEGMANKAVAIELGISERTVEVHRAQVMKKLDVRTLAQLVRIYLQSE